MKDTLQFKIEGMHCVACAGRIERAMATVDGVKHAKVNFVSERASVETSTPSPSMINAIIKAIEREGYSAKTFHGSHHPPPHMSSDNHHMVHEGAHFSDLIIAIVFTLPLIAHMVGVPIPSFIQLICASIVQFWSGRRFYKAAWQALKRFRADMDLLVTIGTSAAYSYSVVAVFIGSHDLYFEASAVVITLVLLGRLLEDRAKRSANTAVHSLMKLTPPSALVERDGVYVEVLSHDIKKGDRIMVRAWQRIPVDGVIFQGSTEVDESMITGESLPVLKETGDKLIGGTMNTSGILYLEATKVGNQSTLARMIQLVEEAQSSRAPIQKFVDQVSAIFVPIVLIISIFSFAGWYLMGSGFEFSLLAAVSVLVVACPCALGLATPTAIVVSMGEAARQGILIKDLESLEALRKVDQVVFDKTGTLTEGKFGISFFESLSEVRQDQVLLIAASLQRGSEHPLAQAFLKAVKGKKLYEVENFESLPGKGVQGKIQGILYYLGAKELMEEQGINVSGEVRTGQTSVYLGEDSHLLALFRLADLPRIKAFTTLETLKGMGLKTVMLTGDNKETATAIGTKVGIDEVMANLQPKDKINYIKAQEQRGHLIAMVGDGVNDGPALAASTVGFAMGSGTDVAMNAAPITLMRPSLELVPQAFLISKRTFRIIQENLFWAFIFNIVGIGFAAFGQISPELAGGAMAASSVMVVGNSLRLKGRSK